MTRQIGLLANHSSPEVKIALFRSLFRGRDDVFPRRFESRRTGKPGYQPACANEWVRGVCDKPRVRCGECLNQAFIPVSDQVILDHFRGRHVMGLYPLLEDDTCWLLAVYFDKGSWKDDVSAFTEICREASIPAAVERSRSGDGAHVWFFFKSPIFASAARKMGAASKSRPEIFNTQFCVMSTFSKNMTSFLLRLTAGMFS